MREQTKPLSKGLEGKFALKQVKRCRSKSKPDRPISFDENTLISKDSKGLSSLSHQLPGSLKVPRKARLPHLRAHISVLLFGRNELCFFTYTRTKARLRGQRQSWLDDPQQHKVLRTPVGEFCELPRYPPGLVKSSGG